MINNYTAWGLTYSIFSLVIMRVENDDVVKKMKKKKPSLGHLPNAKIFWVPLGSWIPSSHWEKQVPLPYSCGTKVTMPRADGVWIAGQMDNQIYKSHKYSNINAKWIKMVWECMKELEWKATCASRSWNRPGSFFVAGSTLQALSTFMSFPKLLWNLWCHPSLHGHPAERWDFQGCPGQTSVLRWNTCSMWWLWIPLEIKHLYIF